MKKLSLQEKSSPMMNKNNKNHQMKTARGMENSSVLTVSSVKTVATSRNQTYNNNNNNQQQQQQANRFLKQNQNNTTRLQRQTSFNSQHSTPNRQRRNSQVSLKNNQKGYNSQKGTPRKQKKITCPHHKASNRSW